MSRNTVTVAAESMLVLNPNDVVFIATGIPRVIVLYTVKHIEYAQSYTVVTLGAFVEESTDPDDQFGYNTHAAPAMEADIVLPSVDVSASRLGWVEVTQKTHDRCMDIARRTMHAYDDAALPAPLVIGGVIVRSEPTYHKNLATVTCAVAGEISMTLPCNPLAGTMLYVNVMQPNVMGDDYAVTLTTAPVKSAVYSSPFGIFMSVVRTVGEFTRARILLCMS